MSDKRDFSFGVIPLQYGSDGLIRVLMVQHRAGHWSFPKGHKESGEGPQETAARELYEETRLRVVRWIPSIDFKEQYCFQQQGISISKEVVYFPAYVTGDLVLQEKEISNSLWLLPNELTSQATFSEMRHLCESVARWLGGTALP